MTEDEYKILCATCDSILLEDHSNLDHIAIPWLHVIREHPVFLEKYQDFFLRQSLIKRFIKYVRYVSADVLLILRLIRRFIFFRGADEVHYNHSCDIIFLSHLLSASQFSTEEDFYFGNIPKQLAQQGVSVLVVLINHTSLPDSHLSEHIKSLQGRCIIIPKTLSLATEI